MKLPKGVKVPIYCYKGDKKIKVQVGYVLDNVYYSQRKFYAHKFRILFKGAFAMSIDVYNQLVNYEVDLVRLYRRLTSPNHGLESDLSQWQHSSMYPNKILGTGIIDPQYVLKEADMRTY